MLCRVQPYEGKDPYIYFSFCPGDEAIAYPILENLGDNGYRVWFDPGMPQDEKWRDTILDHLSGSRLCVTLLSEAFVHSHDCRDQINMALEERVMLIPVAMDRFDLSLGMRLLMKDTRSVRAYEFALDTGAGMGAFLEKLLSPKECNLCRMASSQKKPMTIHALVSKLPEKKPESTKEKPWRRPSLGPILEKDSQENGNGGQAADSEMNGASGREEKTEIIDNQAESDTTEVTQVIERTGENILIDLESGKVLHLRDTVSRLGRSSQNDLCVSDRTISAKHAQVFLNESGRAMVRDVGSTNGTFLNGIKLETDVSEEMGNFSVLSLAKHPFLFLSGAIAGEMVKLGFSAYLVCEENGEVMGLHPDFVLGKDNPWPSGAFSQRYISHEHGIFLAAEGGYRFLASRSTNGTTFNRRSILEGQSTDVLKNGDEIGVAGKLRVKYYVVKLQEDE